ncbi:argininosuccinate lyase [Sandaracinomonas limnophila]|uniref:Argininosuccinate lyase n=1 Tax=Sandaracinomonas limnophila TaxID=1862386 RepID=A0A437PMH8_9BACT|nr:argininosuccinate lyase [Sandaracinomonas limnophila]RVU23496.1 argininosuccinate lyase [Sandaracinomonas limnophila]
MAKLWQKENQKTDAKIEQFTIGNDPLYDLKLAKYDVLGSLAHITMLEKVGILKSEELNPLLKELKNISKEIAQGNFEIENGIEDVHSQIEFLLTQRLGDLGKKIHAGRSRNDQVLVDLKLFMREEIKQIVGQIEQLFDLLISKSNAHQKDLLPGYTHLQVAMPSSFGLWFGAYAESLVEDIELFEAAYRLSNKNPLGSGAGYGTNFPLDRQLTTDLLGFEAPHVNVVNAQLSRGKTELFVVTAIAQLANTLGRLAMDVCLYNSQNFGFIELPSELTTGSSIMPHKKNPDVAELLRGKSNKMKALPSQLVLLSSNLPSGYHREFQLTKEVLMPAIEEIKDCLEITHYMISNIKIKPDLLADAKYDVIFSVEEVNKLVLSGVPFREAYQIVGNQIEKGEYSYKSRVLHHTHLGSIGNLGNEQIQQLKNIAWARFQFEKAEKAENALLS